MNGVPGVIAGLLVERCDPATLRRMRYDALRRSSLHLAESRLALGEVVTIDAALTITREQGSPHGKAGTYNRGCRCDPCRQAKAEYQRTQRQRRRTTAA